MNKGPQASVLTALLFAAASSLSAQEDIDVRSSYHGSSELPDQIAFVSFLESITGSEQSDHDIGLEYVARATGIRLADDGEIIDAGIRQARAIRSRFLKIHERLKRERRQSRIEVLCGGALRQTADQIFDSANGVDDLAEAIAFKYHQIALTTLSASEREHFVPYLADLKSGISYVKLDSRTQIDSEMRSLDAAERDRHVQQELVKYCAELTAENTDPSPAS